MNRYLYSEEHLDGDFLLELRLPLEEVLLTYLRRRVKRILDRVEVKPGHRYVFSLRLDEEAKENP